VLGLYLLSSGMGHLKKVEPQLSDTEYARQQTEPTGES
jgi:hypothetical protein